ncbi:Hypothetical protein D9617_7g030610 [Elsinoe fawcettii]|nr:Hypothetical protein D9617_7g030610 [Elsinoe fawcettii]
MPTTYTRGASLPIFTPAPECLTASNLWQDEDSCEHEGISAATCNTFHLGQSSYWNLPRQPTTPPCYPRGDLYPATLCPSGHGIVRTTEATFGDRTTRRLTCCPLTYSFQLPGPSDVYCTARDPPFTGSELTTLTINNVPSSGAANYPTPTLRIVTLTASNAVLVAPAVSLEFQVAGTKTCAPNCATPWTGGPWPWTAADATPIRIENGGLDAIPLAAGLGTGIGFLFFATCGGSIWGWKRRRRIKRSQQAANGHAFVEQTQGTKTST